MASLKRFGHATLLNIGGQKNSSFEMSRAKRYDSYMYNACGFVLVYVSVVGVHGSLGHLGVDARSMAIPLRSSREAPQRLGLEYTCH